MTFRTIVSTIWTECRFWNIRLHVNLGPREFMLQGSVFLVTEVGVNGVFFVSSVMLITSSANCFSGLTETFFDELFIVEGALRSE